MNIVFTLITKKILTIKCQSILKKDFHKWRNLPKNKKLLFKIKIFNPNLCLQICKLNKIQIMEKFCLNYDDFISDIFTLTKIKKKS